MESIVIVAWLLFSLSGFLALVELFRMPNWVYWRGDIEVHKGLDVSLMKLIFFGIVSLVPLLNIGANMVWLGVAWGYWRKGRPISFRRINPTMLKGRTGKIPFSGRRKVNA